MVENKETYYIDNKGKTILKPLLKDVERYWHFFEDWQILKLNPHN
jgi:hypothetical protein